MAQLTQSNSRQTQSRQSTQPKKTDVFLWSVIIALMVGGVIANSYLSNVALALRVSGWIILMCLVLFLGFTTTSGKKLLEFINGARTELRKIVWPTRDETVRTTMLVAVMVAFMALILSGIDSILIRVIHWISGIGG